MKFFLANALALLALAFYGNNEANSPYITNPEAASSLVIPTNESEDILTADRIQSNPLSPNKNENLGKMKTPSTNRNTMEKKLYRKMRSPTQSNLAIDCENGSISKEHRFEPCLYNQTCHSEDLIILKDLIQHG